MEAAEIHAALNGKFADAISDLTTDNPDPYFFVNKESVAEVAGFLRDEAGLEFDYLASISGVDTTEELHCVYHLFSYKHRHEAVMKVRVAYDNVNIPTVSGLWSAANWHEREQFDLFGFNFEGHPDLRRLLLPEDWVGFPLRKDYEYPEEYHGIDHHRPDPKDQFKALDELKMKARAKKDEAGDDTPKPN